MHNPKSAEPTQTERIRGCLLGGAIGDALGAGIEFTSLATLREQYGPNGVTGFVPAYGLLGAITDDTQMTLFTVEALIEARGSGPGLQDVNTVVDTVWAGYQRWLITQDEMPLTDVHSRPGLVGEPVLQHRRGPGRTCLAGLRRSSHQAPLPSACVDSKGCGTVMRSAPLGLFGMDQAWIARTANACSELTHGHPTAGHSSVALALIIDALLRGLSIRDAALQAVDVVNRTFHDAGETLNALVNAVALAEAGPPTAELVESLGGGWVGEEALAIAVYCALAAPDVRSALLAAVNHSGDSDSTGAICGNILGAGFGTEAFESDWVDGVEVRDLILLLVADIHS
jgi:ADP-ribosylglycohydrolase